MTPAALEREPVTATEEERAVLDEIDRALAEQPRLAASAALHPGSDRETVFRLITPDGRDVPLPGSVTRLLHAVVHHLARDRVVSIVPRHKELTTQQAADLLNVSRPHLISLLDRGAIPYTRPGKHRRLKFGDVLAYKQHRDAEEEAALDELARFSQDLGLYR